MKRKAKTVSELSNGEICWYSTKKAKSSNTNTCTDNLVLLSLFIFLFTCCHYLFTVDGGYGQWSSWGTCSKTCDSGTQTRSRACDTLNSAYRGQSCRLLGQSTDTKSCSNANPCYNIILSLTTTIQAHALITTLPSIGTTFELKFSFYPRDGGSNWGHVMQIMTGTTTPFQAGDRIPDVYYHADQSQLRVYLDRNGASEKNDIFKWVNILSLGLDFIKKGLNSSQLLMTKQ